MKELALKFDGKKIQIKEPTIQMWVDVMKFRDLLDEQELNLKLIAMATGVSEQEMREYDVDSMRMAAGEIYKFINQENKRVFPTIEFNGKTYELIDLNNMTFGQFVDIDTFLQKDEGYRISNLNELAAYLYTEKGTKYGGTDFKKKIEEFKALPIKYVEGAIFFLSALGTASAQLTQLYSKSPLMWKVMMIRLRFLNIGDGILQYLHLPKTRSGKLTMLLISPLLLVSIILHICWTSIIKIKNKLHK